MPLKYHQPNTSQSLKKKQKTSQSIKTTVLSDAPVFWTNTSSHFIDPKPSPVNATKIQIDLVCLYPSIRSLKFQRFGVTQEFSTAVQCLPINNEEQTPASQELYPLCFSSRRPLLLTESCLWALMARGSHFLLCPRHISAWMLRRNSRDEGGGAVFSGLQTSYRYLVHRYMPRLPGGFLRPPDVNTALPAASNLSENRILENPHRSAAMLDLLAPVAPMANVPQQLLCCANPLFFSLLLNLTVTEITAGGAVLLHQASLAVAIAPAGPGRTDK